jgi:hypothetical protein
MASACKWSIGVENPVQGKLIRPILEELDKRAGYTGSHLVAQFEMTQALPNALADMEEGYTNIANDLDCATDLIHVLSSDADDKHDGAGAQAVRIYYLQSGDVYYADYDLEGATHVHLAALGTIDRLIGMKIIGSVNGTGAVVVPQGNIIIDIHAGGTVYCTIVAGDLYSITTKMWVPEGWSMVIASCVPLQTIAEAAAPLLSDGMNVGVNVNGTVQSRSILPQNIGKDFCEPQPFNQPLEGEGYICLQHSQLDTDATACTATQNVLYLLYETPV